MNATIEKLSIKVGDKAIELTMEEAVALQTELNLRLGQNPSHVVTVIRENNPVYPHFPLQPLIVYQSPQRYDTGTPWCGGGNVCDSILSGVTN